MRLSDKKRAELYMAISEPIIQKRIEIKNSKHLFTPTAASQLDDMMFRLEHNIWKEVHKVLNLEGPA